MMVERSINQFHLDDGMMVGNHQTIIRQIQTTISGFCSLGLFTNGHSPDCSQEPQSKHDLDFSILLLHSYPNYLDKLWTKL